MVAVMVYEFPPAGPHGEFEQVFDDVFFITGTVRMAGPPMAFSRNMTVVREGASLTLINSMRLDEAGLAKLEALGSVDHVVRLCGFHGMDDPFYQDRYGAKVWAIEGMRYCRGFDNQKAGAQTYFEASATLTPDTLPVSGARLIDIASSSPPEALILLEREGGVMIAGDSLQNWARPDRYFNLPARVAMRLMGFFKAHNVGPGWLKGAKPDPAELHALLELEFEHLLPVHGTPVIGGAKEKFRPVIERVR